MGKPRYIYNTCRCDFTRMWNANRHRFNQHHGLAEIMPIGDFLLRDKKHSDSEYSKLSRNICKQSPISRGNTVTPVNEDDLETLLGDTLAKLAPKVDELDALLPAVWTTEDKEKFLGNNITRAIAAPDPIYRFDQLVKSVRRGTTSGRMIHLAAKSLGLSSPQAERILQQLFYSSRRTRRINRT